MARKQDFDPSVPLPPGLGIAAIRRAIEYMEKELADLVEIYYEQANVFSAIVGIFGTKALHSVSNYEKHRNIVIIWRVDVVFLEKSNWKYEKSSAGDAGGGRTHTFGVKEPSKVLKGCAVYSRSDVRVKDGKPIPINGDD